MNSSALDASSTRPVGEHERLSFVGEVDVLSRVTCLFVSRGPAAVGRLITELVVSAVERVGRRGALAHVREEGRERVSPLRTDRDATAAVVWVVLVARAIASGFHALPRFVFRCASLAVRASELPDGLWLQTAATPRTRRLPELRHDLFASTIAAALPSNTPWVVTGPSDTLHDYKSSEPLPRAVDDSHLGIIHGNCDVGSDIPGGGAA